MEDFLGQNKTQSIYSLMCDVGNNKFSEIPNIEANNVKLPCENKINVINCKNKDLQYFIDDIEGLDIENKTIQNTYNHNELPHYIPLIDKEYAKKFNVLEGINTVGIRLFDVFPITYRSKGTIRYSNNFPIDKNFIKKDIFKNKKTILFSDGTDTLIEPLWANRNKINFFKELSLMGFSAITGADFSVCYGECPIAQTININKSLLYSSNLSKLNVNTIPHTYAISDFQREKITTWLNNRPYINMITINSQMQRKRDCDLIELKKTIIFLIKNVKQDLHILLHGFPISIKYLIGLENFIDKLHFANSAPFYYAKCRTLLKYNQETKRIEKMISNISEKILVQENIKAYNSLIDDLIYKKQIRDQINYENLVKGADLTANYNGKI